MPQKPMLGQGLQAGCEDGIVIKGNRHGLAITLGPGAWDDELAALDKRIADTPEFFKGARVTLAIGARRLLESDARAARDLLARHDVLLWGVSGENGETRRAAAALGLNAEPLRPEPRPTSAAPSNPEQTAPSLPAPAAPVTPEQNEPTAPERAEPAPPDEPETGLLTRRTLRSGQQLRHPGSICLIGDMNPGSEIVAGGDIVIWGKLRGTVHAGALGDETAQVCALDMQPTQVRIARHIVRSPEDRRRKAVPEVARVRDGQIVVDAWNVR